MSLILNGTDGISDVDGTAATPAIRGTDTNTGIFFGSDIIGFSEDGTEVARFNSSGNLVLNNALTTSTLNAASGVLATQNGMTGIAKAWVNYNGDAQTITGSFNVSSVTYNGTGDYSINFTTAMPNANYAAVGGSRRSATSGDGNMTMQIPTQGTTPTSTVLRVATRTASGSAAYQNCDFTQVAVFSS